MNAWVGEMKLVVSGSKPLAWGKEREFSMRTEREEVG